MLWEKWNYLPSHYIKKNDATKLLSYGEVIKGPVVRKFQENSRQSHYQLINNKSIININMLFWNSTVLKMYNALWFHLTLNKY